MHLKNYGFYWWFCFCLIAILVTALLIFGICMLTISFNVNNPIIVISLFFSSSLMILVSLSLIAGLIARGIERLKRQKQEYPGA